MRWHYTITNEMREAGLSGNSLLVYAVLHGYSQNGQGCFFGTVGYLSEVVGLTTRAVRGILRDLEDSGYIRSESHPGSATTYMCVKRTDVHGFSARKNFPPTPEKFSAPHYKDEVLIEDTHPNGCVSENTSICVDPHRFFHAPTVEEVAAYCASRGNTVDAAAFVAHYQANGWKVGKAPMKDWKAAVRYWETQERQRNTGTPTPQAPSRQQSAYDKMAAMLEENHERLAAEEGGQL